MATFAIYDLPDVFKGNTLPDIKIKTNFSFDAVTVVFKYAGKVEKITLTDGDGLTVTGNEIVFDNILMDWQEGKYTYAVTFDIGEDKKTYLNGHIEVIKPVPGPEQNTGGDIVLNLIEISEEIELIVAAGEVEAAREYAEQAQQSATAAGQSEVDAQQSATNAAGSATTAGNSATAANGSATAAQTSATNAGNSATAAATSATNAQTAYNNIVNSEWFGTQAAYDAIAVKNPTTKYFIEQ